MTPADFDTQFNRLADHFHLPAEASRDTISTDWYQAVAHYHGDAVEHGVTVLIRTAQDTYWPPLGKLLTLIQARIDRYDKTPGPCATCGGTTWVDAPPWRANGQVYTGLQRCPDCGVPAPAYTAPAHREPLTAVEQQAHRDGTLVAPPVFCQPSNQAALDALRLLRATRGRLAHAVEGAPVARQDGAA